MVAAPSTGYDLPQAHDDYDAQESRMDRVVAYHSGQIRQGGQ